MHSLMGGEWRWLPHPDAVASPPLRPTTSDSPAVGVGAICELQSETGVEGLATVHFMLGEYVDLMDGSRVILHMGRGLTLALRSTSPDAQGVLPMNEEALSRQVSIALGFEDPGPDAHSWSRLEELGRDLGVNMNGVDLSKLPYRIEFTPRVRVWLTRHGESV